MEMRRTVGGPRNMPSTVTWAARGGDFCSQLLKADMSGLASPTNVVQTRTRASSKVSLASDARLLGGLRGEAWVPVGVVVLEGVVSGASSMVLPLSGVRERNLGPGPGEGRPGEDWTFSWAMLRISSHRACVVNEGAL